MHAYVLHVYTLTSTYTQRYACICTACTHTWREGRGREEERDREQDEGEIIEVRVWGIKARERKSKDLRVKGQRDSKSFPKLGASCGREAAVHRAFWQLARGLVQSPPTSRWNPEPWVGL